MINILLGAFGGMIIGYAVSHILSAGDRALLHRLKEAEIMRIVDAHKAELERLMKALTTGSIHAPPPAKASPDRMDPDAIAAARVSRESVDAIAHGIMREFEVAGTPYTIEQARKDAEVMLNGMEL